MNATNSTNPGSTEYLTLNRMMNALRVLREATDNPELPVQTMQFFFYVAVRYPNEVPYGEVEKILGMSQASTSRNAAYLARGIPNRGHKGYGMVEVFEDPFYTKRKLIRLTAKGLTVAQQVTSALNKDK
jgi:hypothetical protein